MCAIGPAPHAARGGKHMTSYNYYKHTGKLQRAITSTLRHESAQTAIFLLNIRHENNTALASPNFRS